MAMFDVAINKQNVTERLSEESVNGFTPKRTNVIRKFINSAIYVEKPAISSETTFSSKKYSSEDVFDSENVKTKRCVCSIDQKTCPCHYNSSSVCLLKEPRRCSSSIKMSTSTSTCKVSPSFTSICHVDQEKETLMKTWLQKKADERRNKEIKERTILEMKMKERAAALEQNRENFKTWLANKKRREFEAKKKKEKAEEDHQLKELEKEKRNLENQLNFQLWLKKKQEEQLEKKIKQQVEMIGELERKQRQISENEKAFNSWLKNAKDKQKPVPPNKGIQSLCPSTFVAYVNPEPWNS